MALKPHHNPDTKFNPNRRLNEDGQPKPNCHVDRYLETPPELRDVAKYKEAGNW